MMLSVQNNARQQQQQGQGSIPAGYNRESFKIDYGEHFLSQPDSVLTNQKKQSVETRDGECFSWLRNFKEHIWKCYRRSFFLICKYLSLKEPRSNCLMIKKKVILDNPNASA
jgi:hypothetical protein